MSVDFKKEFYELRRKLQDRYKDNNGNIIDILGPREEVLIKGYDLNELYFNSVLSALKYGRLNPIDSGSFEGENKYRMEFDNANLIVLSPTKGDIAPIPRPGVSVTTNIDNIEKYFNNYIISGEITDNEHYTYGAWIVGIPKHLPLEHKGIQRGTRLNQLEWCVNHFIEKGYGTNHCTITIGCAEGLQRYDWLYNKGDETNRGTSECLRQILFKIRDNKLDMKTIWRSWDLVAGLPENLGGMSYLMSYAVNMINALKKDHQPEIEPGILRATSDGLHIYSHDLDIAKLWTNLTDDKNISGQQNS